MPRGVPARFLEISTLKELDGLLGTQAFFGAQKIQGGPAFLPWIPLPRNPESRQGVPGALNFQGAQAEGFLAGSWKPRIWRNCKLPETHFPQTQKIQEFQKKFLGAYEVPGNPSRRIPIRFLETSS